MCTNPCDGMHHHVGTCRGKAIQTSYNPLHFLVIKSRQISLNANESTFLLS